MGNIKKILIPLLLIVVMLSGCSKKSEMWNSVVNKEFSNFDVWAGSGLYFYEENNINYCTFMSYGSGVYVSSHYTCEVELIEAEKMVIVLPFDDASQYLGEENSETQGMCQVELNYTNGVIKINEYEFKIYDGLVNHDHINDKAK